MMEVEYRIEASHLVSAHIAIGAADGRGIIHPFLVEPPKRKVDRIMWTFQRNDVVTRCRVLSMVFNPLVLGGPVRKDCVVGRKETSQKSRKNGVGVWPS